MELDADDLHNAALCAWKEARGDKDEGMRAVLHIIKNRAGALGFAATVHDVIYGKNQFTSMSVSSDPEFNLEPWPSDVQWLYCQSVAPTVFDGTDEDLTLGAHYYCNPKTENSGWFERNIIKAAELHPFLVSIGKQDFYR